MSFLLSCFLFACQTSLQEAENALAEHDLVRAELKFREVIQLEPINESAIAGLGWTYHLALEKLMAAQSFDRCLQLNPNNIDCLRGRASVALAQQESKKAVQLLAQARDLAPDDPEVVLSKALLDLSQGEHEVALEALASIVRRFPERAEFRLTYAEALLRNKRFEEALAQTEYSLDDEGLALRYQAMSWILRIRILLEGSAGVLERECSQKDSVLSWVSEAERSLQKAKDIGIAIPNIAVIQRQIARRKNHILTKCPNSMNKIEQKR